MAAPFSTTVADVIAAIGGECRGDAALPLVEIAPIETAGVQAISFVANLRYQSKLDDSAAGCVIVSEALAEKAQQRGTCIVTPDPYAYFARLTQWWKRSAQSLDPQQAVPAGSRIHPTAVIDTDAWVAEDATVGPFTWVGPGAVVSSQVVLRGHVCVEAGAHVGAHTIIHSHVTVGNDCVVGQRCIVHAGVVIGADGFGFAPHEGTWLKIEQLGTVRIGDDVEIGANTCIDRGALGDTVISDGVKLDNLIQVGHNVYIGPHSAMAGCVGIAGSARIGARCTVGGGAVVLGHLSLADDVHISAATVGTRSINKPGHYTGVFPIDENAQWEKNAVALKQLGKLRERLRRLESDNKASDA